MKNKHILIIFILLLSMVLTGCSSSGEPNIVITEINTGTTGTSPYYYGEVENKGDEAAHNITLHFTIYETEEKENIIDTTSDYIATGQEIKPGQSASFEAVAYDLESTEQLEHYETEITHGY